jgi:hypothetical protein
MIACVSSLLSTFRTFSHHRIQVLLSAFPALGLSYDALYFWAIAFFVVWAIHAGGYNAPLPTQYYRNLRYGELLERQ